MKVYAFGVEDLPTEEFEETLFTSYELAAEFGRQLYVTGLEPYDLSEGFGRDLLWCGTCEEHADRFMLCDLRVENPNGRPMHSCYYVRAVEVYESVEAAMPKPRK